VPQPHGHGDHDKRPAVEQHPGDVEARGSPSTRNLSIKLRKPNPIAKAAAAMKIGEMTTIRRGSGLNLETTTPCFCGPTDQTCPSVISAQKCFLLSSRSTVYAIASLTEPEDFVLVIGVVCLTTTFGAFMNIRDRRIFIPANCTASPKRDFTVGELATVLVRRSFAKEEKLA
jgi:hypothetical protein